MTLWQRQVTVQIGKVGEAGQSWSNLRTVFDVKHTPTGTPNKAKITVYNPPEDTASLAQEKGAIVQLFAGHEVPQLIFRGNPVKKGVDEAKDTVDRILTIEAQDGGREYQAAHVNISFSTETSVAQILAEAQAQLGLVPGTIQVDDDQRLSKGFAYSGPAHVLLDRIALMNEAGWWISDGTLQIVPKDGDTGEPNVVVFSPVTGNLIGRPKRKDDDLVEVTGLIAPNIRPGRNYVVEGDYEAGAYTAKDVQFQGDSGFDNPFYVIASGKLRGAAA